MVSRIAVILAFCLVAVSDDPVELGIWNMTWRQNINAPTNYAWNSLTVKNGATMRICDVMSDRLNIAYQVMGSSQAKSKWC